MSLPPSYASILNDLNRDVLRCQPADPLQFCANWFNARLEEQRRQILAQHKASSSTSSALGRADIDSANPGSASPTYKPSLFASDPFSQPPHSASSNRSAWANVGSPLHTPSAAGYDASYSAPQSINVSRHDSDAAESQDSYHNPSIDSTGAPFIPPSFNLGRRTSVSAESMAPSAANEDLNHSPLPKTIIPKSEEQMQRIRNSIGNNLLFRNLEHDQYRDVLLAMKEVQVESDVAVIEQGAQGDYFYVVENGMLDVYIRSSSSGHNDAAALGDKKVSYGPGSSFGELALLYAQPRAATVLSTSDCTLWALDRITFRSILMETNSRRRALYEKFLKDVPLFEHLSSAERAKVSDSLELREYGIGENAITQGERGTEFFIIVDGSADVIKTKKRENGGQEEVVGKLSRGDYFGELALLNNAPRAATVVATVKLRVVTMSERAFTRLLGPLAGIMGRHAKETYGDYHGAASRPVSSVSIAPPSLGGGYARSDDYFPTHPMDSNAKPGQGAWSAANPFANSSSYGGGGGVSGMTSPGGGR